MTEQTEQTDDTGATTAPEQPDPQREQSADERRDPEPDRQPDQRDGEEPGSPDADPDLAGLVQMADAYGIEHHLVLTLGGLVVEGTLVGARAFATETADRVQGQDPDGTLRSALAGRFRRRADDLGDWGAASKLGDLDPEGPESEDLPSMPDVTYVHLRDVTVSAVPGKRLGLWRGRLSEVSGWSVGGFDER